MAGTVIIDTLRRGQLGTGTFPVAEEQDLRLSYISVADIATRDTIPEWKRSSKMTAYVIADNKEYRLGTDLTIAGQVWTEKVTTDPNALTSGDILDGDGYIKSTLIKNLFINDSFVVTDEAAMLALTTVIGNVVLQTSGANAGTVWIKLNNDDPSDISDFANITANTGAVLTVNGETGNVDINIASLLAVGQNVTDFNAQVGIAPAVTQNASAISSIQTAISGINAAIALLQGTSARGILIYDIAESYLTGDFIRDINGTGDYELFEAIDDVPIGESPYGSNTADYYKRVGDYYTKSEITSLLSLKADLVSGKIPIGQIPTSLLGVQIVADIAARNALSPYEGLRVIVVDASTDPNLESGSAEYVLDSSYPTADANGFVFIPGSNGVDFSFSGAGKVRFGGVGGVPEEADSQPFGRSLWNLANKEEAASLIEILQDANDGLSVGSHNTVILKGEVSSSGQVVTDKGIDFRLLNSRIGQRTTLVTPNGDASTGASYTSLGDSSPLEYTNWLSLDNKYEFIAKVSTAGSLYIKDRDIDKAYLFTTGVLPTDWSGDEIEDNIILGFKQVHNNFVLTLISNEAGTEFGFIVFNLVTKTIKKYIQGYSFSIGGTFPTVTILNYINQYTILSNGIDEYIIAFVTDNNELNLIHSSTDELVTFTNGQVTSGGNQTNFPNPISAISVLPIPAIYNDGANPVKGVYTDTNLILLLLGGQYHIYDYITNELNLINLSASPTGLFLIQHYNNTGVFQNYRGFYLSGSTKKQIIINSGFVTTTDSEINYKGNWSNSEVFLTSNPEGTNQGIAGGIHIVPQSPFFINLELIEIQRKSFFTISTSNLLPGYLLKKVYPVQELYSSVRYSSFAFEYELGVGIINTYSIENDEDKTIEMREGAFRFLQQPIVEEGWDVTTKEWVQNEITIKRTTKITLSSAEILALYTTPKVLVPAQGVNTFIVLHSLVSRVVSVTTPYATAIALFPYWEISAGITYIKAGSQVQIDNTFANRFSRVTPNTIASVNQDLSNKPLVLRPETTNPTGGDGVYELFVEYSIIDFS